MRMQGRLNHILEQQAVQKRTQGWAGFESSGNKKVFENAMRRRNARP